MLFFPLPFSPSSFLPLFSSSFIISHLFLNNSTLKPLNGAKKGKQLHRWSWGQSVGQNLDFRAQVGQGGDSWGRGVSPSIRWQSPVRVSWASRWIDRWELLSTMGYQISSGLGGICTGVGMAGRLATYMGID